MKTKLSPALWKMYLSVQKSSVSLAFSLTIKKKSCLLSQQHESKHFAVTAATFFIKIKG